jgi:hypothetical protein
MVRPQEQGPAVGRRPRPPTAAVAALHARAGIAAPTPAFLNFENENGEIARARHWHGAAHLKGALDERKGLPCAGPPVGRACEKSKFVLGSSPEIWSETISGSDEVLARK